MRITAAAASVVRSFVRERSWSGPDAAWIAGCAYTTLDAWDRDRVIRPTVPARGIGTRRQYSFRDLVALAAVVQLRDAAAPRAVLRTVAGYIQEHLRRLDASRALAFRNVVLVSHGSGVLEIAIGDPLPRQLLGVRSFHGVCLGPVLTHVLSRSGKRNAQT